MIESERAGVALKSAWESRTAVVWSASAPAHASSTPLTAPVAQARTRLSYLDGIRGLAASYVVLFHAVTCFAPAELPGWARVVRRLFAYGHEAVAVFIVLSGYSLMLPVVRSASGQLNQGALAYLRRRARRILPPYYATLVITLALIAAVPALQESGTHTIWDDSLPAFEAGPLVTHALLVHNWLPSHAFRINGPLWSVATEWQIYFFFPFVLLPAWRRFGMRAALATALVLGYAPVLFARGPSMLAIPWYLFLFTQGMAAAQLGFGDVDPEAAQRRRRAFGRAAALGWSFCLIAGFAAAPLWFRFKPVTDALVGASTAALLVYATERVRAGGDMGRVVGFFQSRPMMALGHASYSLYLTHLPMVALCYFALRPLQLPLAVFLAAMAVTSMAASLLFAAAFYWLIERHFVSK